MDFIGREYELNFLEEKYASKKAELIFLYGRRRVGKTETLRRFCRDKEHVFYSCIECVDHDQLNAFSARMLAMGIPASQYLTRFESWERALESVAELPGDGKKLLIVDEFPYMVRNNRSIPSILQNLWDARLKNENVMIVLCGSAMSFIEKEVLADKNPLYGRATGILKMAPMDFYDAVRFFPDRKPEEQILLYSILGGIPYYLKQFEPEKSVDDNIRANILSRGSILYKEPEFLLRQEFREPALYNSIVEAVALGNTRLNEINQKTQVERSKLSVYLKNLVELGLLEREFPISDGVKEKANVQRGLYRITDNFFRFWFAFVFPNLSELEAGDADSVFQYLVRPKLDVFTSRIFEDVCRACLRRLNRADRLPFHFTQIGRWQDKNEELDVMALDSTKRQILLGECKYRNAPFDLAEFHHMRSKYAPPVQDAAIYYYLFSKSGFCDELRRFAEEEKIMLFGLDEIVRPDAAP